VGGLVASPSSASVLYVSRVRGQVDRTEDGGDHWESIADGLPDALTTGLAINPARPTTLYLGLSEAWGAGGIVARDVSERRPVPIQRPGRPTQAVERPR
jgi:hypothetical protein